MSRILLLVAAATLLSVTACSKNSGEAAPAAAQPTPQAVAPKAVEPAAPAMDEQSTEPRPETTTAKPVSETKPAAPVAMAPIAKAEAPAAPAPAPAGNAATLTKDQALALAGKGNCLACHKIDSKLVGPAWKDVGAKYKGDAKAAATIAAHIKAGGSFGWKFGVMPPRGGSQLSDADVDSLAKFIASLKQA